MLRKVARGIPFRASQPLKELDSILIRGMSSEGPKTATPPPDTARGATADLCDVFVPEHVDIVSQRKVQICEPIFR